MKVVLNTITLTPSIKAEYLEMFNLLKVALIKFEEVTIVMIINLILILEAVLFKTKFKIKTLKTVNSQQFITTRAITMVNLKITKKNKITTIETNGNLEIQTPRIQNKVVKHKLQT